MPRDNLLGQPYQGQSVIASGQRRINIYAESNKGALQAPSPITYYPFPGTELFGTPLDDAKTRCTYRTSIGTAYVVVGPTVYFVNSAGTMLFVGSIPDRASQVYMADNGLAVVLVDGVGGWAIDMVSNDFGPIIDPSFYGADYVVFLDTFFCFNRPDTNQFYISLSMVTYALLTAGTSFDPLDIAAKSGSADPILGLAAVHRQLILIGELTTEIWIGTGAADFYFQIVQGAYIDHGCGAQYSIATQDYATHWLMQDKQGSGIVVQNIGYELKEISTPYLVKTFKSYATMDDAIGMCFQIADHAFYLLVFPTANATWLYDLTTGYWCELGQWNVNTNSFDRYPANCCMFAFGKNIFGHFSTGQLFNWNPDVFTNHGEPIRCVATFMHMVGPNFERVIYNNFDADMEVGTSVQTSEDDDDPVVALDWSDDRGVSFGFPVEQSLGRQGQFFTTVSWNRLGYARDRIFRLTWSAPVKTALNGAFAEIKLAKT